MAISKDSKNYIVARVRCVHNEQYIHVYWEDYNGSDVELLYNFINNNIDSVFTTENLFRKQTQW